LIEVRVAFEGYRLIEISLALGFGEAEVEGERASATEMDGGRHQEAVVEARGQDEEGGTRAHSHCGHGYVMCVGILEER
jgi:uncharacterized protein (UPF0548 family)